MNKDIAADGSEIVAVGCPNSDARKDSKIRWRVSYLELVTLPCGCCDERVRTEERFLNKEEALELMRELEEDPGCDAWMDKLE